MTTATDDASLAPPSEDPSGDTRNRTGRDRLRTVRFSLHWHGDGVAHTDALLIPGLDPWRDLVPPALAPEIMGKPVGHEARHRFAPGALLPAYREDRLLALRRQQFNSGFLPRGPLLQPFTGRFYPKGILRDIPETLAADPAPFRVAQLTEDGLTADLNHPLADKELEVGLRIEGIHAAGDRRGGHRYAASALLTANGPGMQARWRGRPTDFLSEQPFLRADPRPDAEFYDQPRLVDHIDRRAIAEISALHGRLIPRGARILDLMASWHSHLPASLAPDAVTGLGMSQAELDANEQLTGRVVQDLNQNQTLPFDADTFDAAVCTVSVEYLIQPHAVFRELARVLRPGGWLIVSFSNRWFPSKVIRAWATIHEFERLGLVLEYFRESGAFTDLKTFSLRDLPRPADDRCAVRLAQSDPVYAVWGQRSRAAHGD